MPTKLERDATHEQYDVAKRLRKGLVPHIKKRRGGVTFKGAKSVGKTRMIGLLYSKAPKGETVLNLWAACKTDHAEKQAADVGVASGDKPLTQGRLGAVTKALKSNTNATFALTPTSFGNMINPDTNFHGKFLSTVKASGVTYIRLSIDEAHKALHGSSKTPGRVDAWRKALLKHGITVVVVAVTATPLWDVKSKAQDGQAVKAFKLLGLEVGEGETTVGVLKENTVEVRVEEEAAIFAVTKPLQTKAPEKFERRELAIPGGIDRSQEVAAHIEDARPLLLGLALDGGQGHIDRINGLNVCNSMAVAQMALDRYAIDEALPKEGVQCNKVQKAEDGTLELSEEETLVRANALIVVDTPEARKYLVEQLQDRAENEEDARPMEFFDLTTKDRATFNAKLEGFHKASTDMSAGHPIGIIEPSQLEGSNEFGKNVFAIIAVGDFKKNLLDQGAGRLGRSVPMKAGDLVPTDGYQAIHVASKWQSAVGGTLKSKVSSTRPLPKKAAELLAEYEKKRGEEVEELFGEQGDDDNQDPVLERVATTAKQLAKLDAANHLLAPHDLAKTYLEAMLDDGKQEKLLQEAFGKRDDADAPNKRGLKRDRAGSVLAKYLPVSDETTDETNEAGDDEVMADAGESEPSDSETD